AQQPAQHGRAAWHIVFAARERHTPCRPQSMIRRALLALLIASLLAPASAMAESSGWQILLGDDDANPPPMPSGVAVDPAGRSSARGRPGRGALAAASNHRSQRLGRGPDGHPLAQWRGVHAPHGIAVDAQDAVYVSHRARLRKFPQNGELLADWTRSGQFGGP